MAQKLSKKDLVTFEELVVENSIQVDALAQLLMEKGIITKDEFVTKFKQVQAEYEAKKSSQWWQMLLDLLRVIRKLSWL